MRLSRDVHTKCHLPGDGRPYRANVDKIGGAPRDDRFSAGAGIFQKVALRHCRRLTAPGNIIVSFNQSVGTKVSAHMKPVAHTAIFLAIGLSAMAGPAEADSRYKVICTYETKVDDYNRYSVTLHYETGKDGTILSGPTRHETLRTGSDSSMYFESGYTFRPMSLRLDDLGATVFAYPDPKNKTYAVKMTNPSLPVATMRFSGSSALAVVGDNFDFDRGDIDWVHWSSWYSGPVLADILADGTLVAEASFPVNLGSAPQAASSAFSPLNGLRKFQIISGGLQDDTQFSLDAGYKFECTSQDQYGWTP